MEALGRVCVENKCVRLCKTYILRGKFVMHVESILVCVCEGEEEKET